MTTYYPQVALAGFASAVNAKLNVNISFVQNISLTTPVSGSAFIPPITGTVDQATFLELCGLCIHEASHAYFDSVAKTSGYCTTNLRTACMGAVLDVSDESRILSVLPQTHRLLRLHHLSVARQLVKGTYSQASGVVPAILCAAYLAAHRSYTKDVRRMVDSSAYRNKVLSCWRVLKKCVSRRNRNISANYRNRSRLQIKALETAADELVEILKEFGESAGGSPVHVYGACSTGAMTADQAVQGGSVPGWATLADGEDGEACVTGQVAVRPQQAQQTTSAQQPSTMTTAGVGGYGGCVGTPVRASLDDAGFDSALYGQIKPSLAGPIQRMIRADDADGLDDGYASGPRIGSRIERAMIDGRCFARRNSEGERINAVVMLDVSGSMKYCIKQCAGVAQAFTDSLAPVAESVTAAIFGTFARGVSSFRGLTEPNEGTNTDYAVEFASKVLANKRGKRVLIIITDGEPGDPTETRNRTRDAISKGIKVIGVAYGCDVEGIADTMPGAQIVGAYNPASLASQMSRIAAVLA